MDAFVWNSWFKTGIDPVDEQHQQLVALVNELATTMLESQGNKDSLQVLFKNLFKYARHHFSDEENLMAQHGIDVRHLNTQRKEHAEFIREVAAIAKTQSTDPRADFEMLYRYLVSWLSYHILGTDHAMARQIECIRSGMSAAQAFEEEINRQGHDLPAMQAALSDLYEIVAEQNKRLRANSDLLEKKIAERTQALETSNTDLLKEQQTLRELNQKLEQAQNQLLQAEKMSAIGQLAAGVAHEINNPIGYVNSNLGTLKTYVERLLDVLSAYADVEKLLPESTELAALHSIKQTAELDYLRQDVIDLLRESRDGLGRVTKIVQDLKDFSHVDDAEWTDADLNHGLDSTLNVVWNEVKYKAQVIKDYGDIPLLHCAASQINQVFMNLIVNASHAIEESGTITLRTRLENEQIMVEVTDTGKGIPPEIQRRIFEPFFTTKPVGKGTGLGLSLSYDIVKKHGGHIDVSSEPGKGTSFKIWLPLAHEAESA